MLLAIAALLEICAVTFACALQQPPDPGRAEIEAFNRGYASGISKRDNASVLSVWLEDGMSLLPDMAPLASKREIRKFLDDVSAQIAGSRMQNEDINFRQIQVMGSWAYQWRVEHQRLQLPDGKPTTESWGSQEPERGEEDAAGDVKCRAEAFGRIPIKSNLQPS
jgi:ketosteroid isomerase-like protein